ncbi:hypothetical protein JAAARDRAFT_117228 [Jaapia argillacea MUCL 33604]|uniref:CxC2-like cysteine cluster KDZ transposase-associated domain-containing protein n=1 Tax=Jaapia argillacea MUCL 33604 TaxID=933084 RepID=A0A067QNP9_9AGAM|nr:hypothetical protein JAAARDRAFT_117228 [Jaapia argillacea MUCL 33604]
MPLGFSTFQYVILCTIHLHPIDSYTTLQDCLQSFMLMVRQFHHCLMAKRAGRGHDLGGIQATVPGGLAVPCRACPWPGVNLPEGFDQVPTNDAWIYCLFTHMDCNFHMSNQTRPNQDQEFALSEGLTYFVEKGPFNDHIRNNVNKEDVKGCVGFAALVNTNNRQAKGLLVTGLCGMSCRHELWFELGLCNLQKGERYCNVDFVYFSNLQKVEGVKVVSSYDIACEWHKNLWKRMDTLPPEYHLKIPKLSVTFLVNKFHLVGHARHCQAPFSFNFQQGIGHSNREGPKRMWAVINGAGLSTKQMGSGTRQDSLTDFCGFMNWLKTIGVGKWSSLFWQSIN